MESIFISGATGLIGRALIGFIDNNDFNCQYRIIAGVRNYGIRIEAPRTMLDYYLYHNGDSIPEDLEIDYLVCLGGATSKKHFSEKPVETWRDNVLGIADCLEYAKKRKIKGLLFASSAVVYGMDGNGKWNESHVAAVDYVRDAYSSSKIAGESLCNSYFREHNVPVKIVRIFQAYSEKSRFNNGTFLSECVNNYLLKKPINIYSDGSAIRSFIHIEDTVSALWKVLIDGKAGETYNVGSETSNLSMREVALIIQKHAKEKGMNMNVSFGNSNQGRPDVQTPDLTKLKALGWQEKKRFRDEIGNILDNARLAYDD